MLKSFVVFNLDQIAGLDHLRPQPPKAGEVFEPILVAEEILKKSGARIVEGGPRTFYQKLLDLITLPDRWRFEKAHLRRSGEVANFVNAQREPATYYSAPI